MDLKTAIQQLSTGQDLASADMQSVMELIMQGAATDAQIGAWLTALAMKGESSIEITAAAKVMRALASSVQVDSPTVVDSVGTGGDGAKLFNISTASALVAAAAGAIVAKHGNRAATGNSGSADVLEAAGVNINLNSRQVSECIAQCGLGFLFAPMHHQATKHVISPRREIGIRTMFNLLGPLTNPTKPTHQLVGVFDKKWQQPLAQAFAELGSMHSILVCSDDGLDEISIAAATSVVEYRAGNIHNKFSAYRITPDRFGMKTQSLDDLMVTDAAHSLQIMQAALSGKPGPAFDMVALNAGATLYAADSCPTLEDGINLAKQILQSGAALTKLEELIKVTNQLSDE